MAFSHVLSVLVSLFLWGDRVQPHCRCLYGQDCWPSKNAFASLSIQLTRPLLYPQPPASRCYVEAQPLLQKSAFGTDNCSDIIHQYTNGTWRADEPGAMQNTNFETFLLSNGTIEACYLDVTLGSPCLQGSIPPVGVDARTVTDIQAAINFAKRSNLRLVVKNTGHDYLGRSAGRGGFMVWTHNLKDKTFNSSFIPDGAPSSERVTYDAVTFGSGVQWHEAYTFVHQHGRSIVGGISLGGSVGSAGGWIMGGGHSALSPSLGLGVDNVLQFTIVLANGTYITANAYQHSNLFWALRGGGGGTYGIVVSVTYQTHPSSPLTMSLMVANFTSPLVAQRVATEFVKLHAMVSDAGWGGYTSVSNTNFQMLFVKPNISSVEDANLKFRRFIEFARNATEGQVQNVYRTYSTFLDWYDAIFTSQVGQVGSQVEITSRLLPRDLAVHDPAKAAKLMLSVNGGVITNSVAGGAVSHIDPSSTGLNPSWRRAIAEVYSIESWPEGSSEDTIIRARNRLKSKTDILDKLTTDSGAYLNEASLHERDFKKSFFGSHYARLKDIKEIYDPTSLFVVASGIGSDDWDGALECRL
ncbi:hypothetical protein CVT25_012993 [Psilocybe cyanescens]|uniref:FAD-binding PCMH-type domain-containing protein n=1 Tax=Psilocybe cyanescens TaxID=93625 RepID=A0A409XHK4_PSICY|nr:hypothetical protein CVT25_012993 [Psilocybe cyanescens]